MILLSLDFETTGLDTQKDRVIEFGAVLYSTSQKKCLDNQGMLVKTDVPITNAITKITGIHPAAVERFGYESADTLDIVLGMVESCDAVIGFNIRRFDMRILSTWMGVEGRALPKPVSVIDLYQDLPWQVPMGKLSHVAADHGILNLFPHSALADAQTVLAIAEKYDSDLLLSRAQSPVVILQAHQDRANNDLVKQTPFKFRWNPSNKIWWKPVKEQDVTEVIQSAPFPITIEKGWTIEELD